MKGFSKRDYLIAAVIIGGVLLSWFLLMATLLHLAKPEIAIPIVFGLSILVYWIAKHNNKPS